jgi:hypothetical protein
MCNTNVAHDLGAYWGVHLGAHLSAVSQVRGDGLLTA